LETSAGPNCDKPRLASATSLINSSSITVIAFSHYYSFSFIFISFSQTSYFPCLSLFKITFINHFVLSSHPHFNIFSTVLFFHWFIFLYLSFFLVFLISVLCNFYFYFIFTFNRFCIVLFIFLFCFRPFVSLLNFIYLHFYWPRFP
jgi:hypothetical protein